MVQLIGALLLGLVSLKRIFGNTYKFKKYMSMPEEEKDKYDPDKIKIALAVGWGWFMLMVGILVVWELLGKEKLIDEYDIIICAAALAPILIVSETRLVLNWFCRKKEG